MDASTDTLKRIAIVGGGPAGLFLFKRLLETEKTNFTIDIFEAKNELGNGMPYSSDGANVEHITNVSGNEIPPLVTTVMQWLETVPRETLDKFELNPDKFSEFKVLPRLLFGEYLAAQFSLLLKMAKKIKLQTTVHLNTRVKDIIDVPEKDKIILETSGAERFEFDHLVICTGHNWLLTHEGKVPGYFDSPYPPSKLSSLVNHEIAVRGSSLTAIDAVRTLARNNGVFVVEEPNRLSFIPNRDADDFKIIMNSRQGLLPAVRFHLDDPRLSKNSLLSKDEIAEHRSQNDGFLSLDFIFEKDFKNVFIDKDPGFYERIKNMSIEEFVEAMMNLRESVEPFLFFKGEYTEAKKSIRRKESVYWKEMLAVLSFAMNYPAKHLSAEDMQRLQHVLMPLISIVIAFVPQSSCEELIALYDAGRLELVPVGDKNEVEVNAEGGIIYRYTDEAGKEQEKNYQSFIDCIGQRHLSLDAFPFESLVRNGTVSRALLKFRSPEAAIKKMEQENHTIEAGINNEFYLKVPGIAIADNFRVQDKYFAQNPRLYMMAVPYIGGFNPDYSGLDFCEEASKIIVDDMEAGWKIKAPEPAENVDWSFTRKTFRSFFLPALMLLLY